ncbi:MAG: bifunctional [glutamate--ammonia ligase]-adenylyl-L-tyrosine phosphorylase/[glutamate--ammonia-ligase] adenylyltransferase, partial [Kangiellaceae bacterium]|nr:bifunctional [glutamate--ammonia ligase]-adenylyl-L-tyrosine phosphorylase/[glutamate--ammonia-ligase] adenylyltransferase [Kangiellaceae bacterium]
RFAMIRARIITGRSDEAQQLKDIITPFAFRRYIDYGVIDSLRNMKAMIQREVRRRGLKGNIKLGAGGIREIEFMVQSLQLIQGGRDKRLQQRNILKVLPILALENLLPNSTATELGENYRFLRRLEHCIQELGEKQTQQLPEDKITQTIIAKVMGYDDWNLFQSQLNNRLENTNQHFSALFGEEPELGEEHDDFYISLWEAHIFHKELAKKIECDLDTANRIIEILTEFKKSNLLLNLSVKGARRLGQFFPILLEMALAVENPVETLERLLTVLRAILMRTAYLELLSENLPLLQHLVDLVSRSEWVVKRLSECPILLDELLYPNSLYQPLQTSDLQSELQQSLLRIDEQDEEQLLDAIRQFKLINELRVAAALLAERLSISQVNRYLTQLAQVIIQAALKYSWNKVTKRHGKPSGLISDTDDELKTGFLIIGYGKLGGLELGFNSDLDLVFLFDEDFDSFTDGKRSISIGQFYTRLAQKLIHFLSTRTSLGVLYEVDMRLRPSGSSGLLVSHISAFVSYQKESAWTWEHQALTRTRPISGDHKLASKFEELRSEVINSKTDQNKLKKDVIEMRIRMRNNLDKSVVGKIDLKQCKGGLVDIEFIAQYLVLSKNGRSGNNSYPDEAIPSNTVEMIKYSQKAEIIKSDSATLLIKTYRKYRNYLNEQSIIGGEKLVPESEFSLELDEIKIIWNSIL